MEIVQNILKITKENNLNNQQLCKLLNTNPNKIYDWKIGKSKPSAEDVYILADYFNCSVDYLLGRTDCPYMVICNGDGNPMIHNPNKTNEMED